LGRHKGRLPYVLDEPPEALYNQWITGRMEFYKRVEPLAAKKSWPGKHGGNIMEVPSWKYVSVSIFLGVALILPGLAHIRKG